MSNEDEIFSCLDIIQKEENISTNIYKY